MIPKCLIIPVAAVLIMPKGMAARSPVHITPAYANTNAQSLIGLPMGNHKTIVNMQGNLLWSQWSLKRRGLDAPVGFSDQLDGEPVIQIFGNGSPLKVTGQRLYRNHFPFVATHLTGNDLQIGRTSDGLNCTWREYPRPEHSRDVRRQGFFSPQVCQAGKDDSVTYAACRTDRSQCPLSHCGRAQHQTRLW